MSCLTSGCQSAAVTLSATWQSLEVSTTIVGANRSELDLYVAQSEASAGQSFQVDDVRLTYEVGGGESPSARELNARTYDGALFAASSPWNATRRAERTRIPLGAAAAEARG